MKQFCVRRLSSTCPLWPALFLAIALLSCAGQSLAAAQASLRINVRVYNYSNVSRRTLMLAEEESSRIFRGAGVELAWLDCPTSHAEEEKYPACALPLGAMAVDLRIVPSPMAARSGSSGEQLGFALPSSRPARASAAWVYSDRAERLAESGVASCDQILGHGMAHEIGHLLLGSDSHSAGGIMRANWDRKCLEEASQGQLLFTRNQARLIRAEVQERATISEVSVER